MLEWIAISFSRESSYTRNKTHVSCISCIGKQILYHEHHMRSHLLLKISTYYTSGLKKKWMNYKIIATICGEGNGTPLQYSFAWKTPWMEGPGGLQSMGSLRVRHDWATSLSLFTFMHWRMKWQPTPVFLPGESQGRRSLVGCRSTGLHRVGYDWNNLAAAAAAATTIWNTNQSWIIFQGWFKHTQ